MAARPIGPFQRHPTARETGLDVTSHRLDQGKDDVAERRQRLATALCGDLLGLEREVPGPIPVAGLERHVREAVERHAHASVSDLTPESH